MTGPHRSKAHVWGPMPPGTGRGEMCMACGLRRAQVTEDHNAQCKGRNAEHVSTDVRDYEPFDDE